jgi:hypothetical protein
MKKEHPFTEVRREIVKQIQTVNEKLRKDKDKTLPYGMVRK